MREESGKTQSLAAHNNWKGAADHRRGSWGIVCIPLIRIYFRKLDIIIILPLCQNPLYFPFQGSIVIQTLVSALITHLEVSPGPSTHSLLIVCSGTDISCGTPGHLSRQSFIPWELLLWEHEIFSHLFPSEWTQTTEQSSAFQQAQGPTVLQP